VTILRSGSATDVGRVRAVNEDQKLESPTLFAVADGMGGHVGGDVAANTAIDALAHRFNVQPSPNGLVQAVRDANTAVWEKSNSDPDLRGMGTTVTTVGLVNTGEGDRLVLANVGDSRAYRLRSGSLEQLTVDHSVAEELVARGELTPAQADIHPHRHILTRALGVGPDVDVDVWEVVPRQGDRIVLCSDGLSNELSNEAITRVLLAHADPQEAAEALVSDANTAGGSDNITVVVVDVLVGDEDEPEKTAAALAASPSGSSAPAAAGGTADAGEDPPGAGRGVAVGTPAGGAAGARGAAVLDEGGAPGPAGRAGVVTLSTTTIPTTGAAPSGGIGSPPPAPGPPSKDKGRRRDRGPRKPRRITFRVLFFLLLLAGLGVGAWYLVRWYSDSSYYVALVYDPSLPSCRPAVPDTCKEVVIYQGRPGGVFGIEPKIVVRYPDVTRDKVPDSLVPAGVPNLDNAVQESSLGAAQNFVHLLECGTNALAPASAPVFPGVSNCPTTVTPSTTPGATTTTAHALGRPGAGPERRAA